ncbi:alanine racemase [Conexibacter stalactiti]|uniref:Alanine racemase n=1 Tax=Conexibacter stalactiti TaxID=1940611 RepID=A0ABU4HS72_9ACTN|nr:alanine racemase [Conexibacter stalactiti]MDW5596141.1 alanine racemase [Conexibacter stalactiti]MEC5036783.1 alanine racemase [Conexibacter stalactiti]
MSGAGGLRDAGARAARWEDAIGRHVSELETPVVVADLDVVDRNVARAAAYARERGLALWPHLKTHKTVALAARQRDAGAAGFTVAKTREAELFAAAGFGPLLLHYPAWGTAKWERLAQVAGQVPLTVALDSLAAAEGLDRALRARGTSAEVLIELDAGMRRTGVGGAAEALALAEGVERLAPAGGAASHSAGGAPMSSAPSGASASGLRVAGISCYPGHVRGTLAEVRDGLARVEQLLRATRDAFAAAGIRCDRVSGGSTATLFLAHETVMTEVRAGNYVFLDRSEARGAWQEDDAALQVHASVISTSVPGRMVLDTGSKTLGEAGAPAGLTGWGRLTTAPGAEVVSLNEEHAVCELPPELAATARVGDRHQLVPNHACTCVNLHDAILAARNGVVEEVWPLLTRGEVR